MQSNALVEALEYTLWQRGDIEHLLLHRGQLEILVAINALPSSTKEVCLRISRRYGKSYLAVVIAFITCLKKPNAHVIIAAPSKVHAYNIIVPIIRQVASKAPQKLLKQLKSELRWQFSNGSQLTLGGFDSAAESLRGLTADLVVVEEGGVTSPHDFMYTTTSILLPVLLSTGGRMIHVYTPAVSPDHPIHTITEEKASLNNALFVYDIHSCPLYSTKDVEEMCLAVGGKDSLAWKREFLVKVERDNEKTCVPEFSEERHVGTAIAPPGTKYWIAADIGGTVDFSTFHLYAFDYTSDKVLVLAEKTLPPNPSNPLIRDAIEALRCMSPSSYVPVFIDAPGSLKSDLTQTYGLSLNSVSKPATKFGIHEKLVLIRHALATDKILISPSCKLLITTLRSAQFNASRTDYQRTDLIGHADHLDTLLYGYRHREQSVEIPARNPDEAINRQLQEMDERWFKEQEREWWDR
jgi:hypothetical protein